MVDFRQLDNLYITLSGDGATDLVCLGARIREGYSTLSEMRMEFVSKDSTFKPWSVLGKKITLETSADAGAPFRFSGVIVSVQDAGLLSGNDVFAAEVRPWLWMTTIGEDNRIFQGKSAVEIIEAVLNELNFGKVGKSLKGSYATRDYCVQYGETTFAFLSRLMEEEGIHYYFDHAGEQEQLMLVDELGADSDLGQVHFTVANATAGARAPDRIYEWSEVGRVVSGKATLWDYDFTKPNSNLVGTASIASGGHAFNQIERYQSGGHYTTAEQAENFFAKTVAQANAAQAQRAMGLCNLTTVRTGKQFDLVHPDQPAFEGKYQVAACTHYLRFSDNEKDVEVERWNRNVERIAHPEGMALFETEFEVMPAAIPFKPQKETPWPAVPSLLTAVVTGPSGEEIHTDEYGRIKVQFPWDRMGKKDDQSSVWVRTVMPWVGKGYGFIAVPRIGMEVVIQFERGNIDRPICTGMIYNGMNKAPYPLPGDMNKVSLRTNSTKDAGSGHYHELTFDDTKGSEKVLFQSEKDYEQIIKNNATISIGLETKDAGDLTQTIQNSKTETLKEGDWTLTVEKGNRIAKVKTDDTTTVEGKSTTKITGNTELEIGQGNLTETVKMGNMSTEVSMGNQATTVKMGNISIKADLGKIEMEAMQSIELKVGGSSITIDQMGVTIKGAMKVGIEAALMAEMKASLTTVKADALLTLKGSITMIN